VITVGTDKLRVNIQMFAGDSDSKTEKATPKKRRDVREKGQIIKSRELSGAIVLMATFAALKITGGYIFNNISSFTVELISEYPKEKDFFTTASIQKLFIETIIFMLKVLAPLFGSALFAGLLINYGQVGFLFTTEPLLFKLSRINPINGVKKILSSSGMVELLKSLIKILTIGYLAYSFMRKEANNILALMSANVTEIAGYISKMIINAAFRIWLVLVILGVLDYLYQWWEYEKNLRMSKEEIKEEHKQVEGNPVIKSRIRQKQRQLSMRRMLHSVPKADVIITNPTHYAIAIKYDPELSEAPIVSAKGQGYLALRIKKIAEEHGVEIVENKPLAKTLYQSVEINQSIPPELYQAVAEILAFVYSLRN
jgi:flagellar biosynthetic protein FlhB